VSLSENELPTLDSVIRSVEQENELASLVRLVWGDGAVEYLVGLLSSVVSEKQLDTLIEGLTFVVRLGGGIGQTDTP